PPRETDVEQFRTLPPARSRLHRSYFLEPPDEPPFHLPGPLAFEDLEEAIPSLLQERLSERENSLSHLDLLEVVQFPYPRACGRGPDELLGASTLSCQARGVKRLGEELLGRRL